MKIRTSLCECNWVRDLFRLGVQFPLRLLWVTCIVWACASGCTDDRSSAPVAREAISIGVPQEPLGMLVIVAQEKGFFEDAQLDVTVVDTYPSGKRALQGMLEGEVDLTVSSEVPLVFQAFSRADFRILATIGISDNEPCIIGRQDRGIHEPKDLRGKKIATQRASAVHYFLHLFLLKHGIEDAELKFLKAEDLPRELAEGHIDAFSMREPFIGEALEMVGDNGIVFHEPGMYLKTMNLIAPEWVVEERSGALEKVLRALVRSEEYFREHRAEAVSTAAAKLNTNAEQLGRVLQDIELDVALSHALVVALEDEARWAIDSQFVETQHAPDFQQLIAADAIRATMPAAVTIID